MAKCKSEFDLYVNEAGNVAIKSLPIGEAGSYKPTGEGEAKALLLDAIAEAEERGTQIATQRLFVPSLAWEKGTKAIPVKALKKALAEAKNVAFLVGRFGPYVAVLTQEAPNREGSSKCETIARRTASPVAPGAITRRR